MVTRPLLASILLPRDPEENDRGAEGNASNNGMGTPSPNAASSYPPSKHSRIVSVEYLQDISKRLNKLDKKPAISLPDGSPRSVGESSVHHTTDFDMSRHTISIPVSPHIAYDFTHSCTECSKYLRGSPVAHPEILTSILPTEQQGPVKIQWHVPTYQQKHCVISHDRKTLERLKLPMLRLKGEKTITHPLTPIFTPTIGRDSTGLFNLFHTMYDHLHVLVTTSGQFEKYCKAWPNHLIMALPDEGSLGLGEFTTVLGEAKHGYISQLIPWGLHYS